MKTLKVVKIGGNIIDNNVELVSFLKDFASLKGPKILVHGGGKSATKLANKMNIPVQMIDGRRVTDAETLEIVTMVYAGKINKNIVAILQSFNCNSIGFSGADGNTIIAKKRPKLTIDYGFVGDVVKVNISVIKILIDNNITNIFSAISHDETVQLYYCFEKKGVLKNIDNNDSVIEKINQVSYQELKSSGIINEGMIPKLDNCFYALEKNVSKVCIGKSEMLFNKEFRCTTIQ